MGGGSSRASTAPVRTAPPLQHASHHSRARSRHTRARHGHSAMTSTYPTLTSALPNSSLPPSRWEVRWGVGGCERAQRQSAQHRLSRTHPITPAPVPVILAPVPPYPPPVPPYPPPSVIPAQAGMHAVGAAQFDAGHSVARKRLWWAVATSRRVEVLEAAQVPACAGMTGRGAGMTVGVWGEGWQRRMTLGVQGDGCGGGGGRLGRCVRETGVLKCRWRSRVASHPPPNLPPGRGGGMNWGGGGCGGGWVPACAGMTVGSAGMTLERAQTPSTVWG